MTRERRRGWWLARVALVWLACGAASLLAQSVRITPLARGEHVLVTFELSDAYTDQLRAAIESGLTATFTYDVELRRATPLWVDRTIDVARVAASVTFDNLTRRYQVSITRDGRVEESWVTEDEGAVRRAVTVFSRLPLFSTRKLEPNAEYYIRVKARTRPHNVLFFLPWDRDGALGSATFTFLPQ
jgi:hypothetical protein